MCEPLTIASIGLGALSTGMSAVGQAQSAKAQQQAGMASASYNKQVALNEAETQKQLAQAASKRGEVDADRQTLAARQRMGTMRANMGASGFAMDSGTMLDLAADAATAEQYDIGIIRNNAANEAWQHQVAAANYLNEADLQNYQYNQAKNSTKGLGLQLAGTILGGVADGMTKFSSLKATQSPSATSFVKPNANGKISIKSGKPSGMLYA